MFVIWSKLSAQLCTFFGKRNHWPCRQLGRAGTWASLSPRETAGACFSTIFDEATRLADVGNVRSRPIAKKLEPLYKLASQAKLWSFKQAASPHIRPKNAQSRARRYSLKSNLSRRILQLQQRLQQPGQLYAKASQQ